jgi:hypothetical protein
MKHCGRKADSRTASNWGLDPSLLSGPGGKTLNAEDWNLSSVFRPLSSTLLAND